MAVPNVYHGWIQNTVATCGNSPDPCSSEIVGFLNKLDPAQKSPAITPRAYGTVTGTVFQDNNGNGMQDAGERGIPGQSMLVINAATNSIVRTTTDASGEYAFDKILPPPAYCLIRPESAHAGHAPTTATYTYASPSVNEAVTFNVGYVPP